MPLALLGICDRRIVASFSGFSVYRRTLKKVTEHPQTLGEHLRRKRVDAGMTHLELSEFFGVAYQTVERWEHDRVAVSGRHRTKIVAFLGYDPDKKMSHPAAESK